MKTFILVLMLVATTAIAGPFPIASGRLDTDFNGNHLSGTNFKTLSATNFIDLTTGLPLATGGGGTTGAVTNNHSVSQLFSNVVKIDAAHALFPSNATPSKLATIGADNTLTNLGTLTGLTLTGNGLTRDALTGDITTSGNAATLAAGSASVLNSGTLLAARLPALTGAITTSAGSAATSLGSFTSAALLGAVTDETGGGLAVFGTSPTIVTPTIADLSNMTHTHQNNAGGGALSAAAITSGTFTLAGARFASQGTTAQVLHGNASGNPSWGPVDLSAEVTGSLPIASVSASGLVVTNGEDQVITVSNDWRINITHALSPSNSTPSRLAVIGADNTLTNLGSLTGLTLSANGLSRDALTGDYRLVGVSLPRVHRICRMVAPESMTHSKLLQGLMKAITAKRGSWFRARPLT